MRHLTELSSITFSLYSAVSDNFATENAMGKKICNTGGTSASILQRGSCADRRMTGNLHGIDLTIGAAVISFQLEKRGGPGRWMYDPVAGKANPSFVNARRTSPRVGELHVGSCSSVRRARHVSVVPRPARKDPAPFTSEKDPAARRFQMHPVA